MNTQPLVSCIMPTYNRRRFVPQAIEYFLRQDYPEKELVILDDGDDNIADLVPIDPRIRYLRQEQKSTTGAKRNKACEEARGEIIVHWDDDDWMSPWRVSYQVRSLLEAQADICGLNQIKFYNALYGQAWEYIYQGSGRAWVYGATLCYTKSFWRQNPFPAIAIGEDTKFVWSRNSAKVVALEDRDWIVCMMHPNNVSPKRTEGNCWHRHPAEEIEKVLGCDLPYYQHESATGSGSPRAGEVTGEVGQKVMNPSYQTIPIRDVTPIRNVYACLVHENPECVIDLVCNLRYLDGSSRILLYDGSNGGNLLDKRLPWSRWGVEICPQPRSMKWGQLHGFALDCLRYLKSTVPFDVMTVVDSDQLALRMGYADFLSRQLGDRTGLGLLSSAPERQGPNTRIPPAVTAQLELNLWRPFLRRFPGGEDKFVHWTFWPSTVITADAGFALLDLFDQDAELARILEASRLWATEEVLFPTLTALLGFRVERNPCASDYVQYRKSYGSRDVDAALRGPNFYWMHPVPRRYDDPLRKHIRQFHGGYLGSQTKSNSGGRPHADQLWPMLRTMRGIEGWLEDEEAELLAIAAREVVTGKTGTKTIVEIGSYCGKATFVLASVVRMYAAEARVLAVDTFDGVVGALDIGLIQRGPTLQKFTRMLEETELATWVDIHVGRAPGLSWDKRVDLLLVDGLHDYASVAQDFYAFEAWLKPGALAAFHDYAEYYPGVRAFVDELLRGEEWEEAAQAGTMKLLRRLAQLETATVAAPTEPTVSEKISQTMDEGVPRVSLA